LILLIAVAADHRDAQLQAGAGIAAFRIGTIHDPSATTDSKTGCSFRNET
jgi:hypothetical protein